MKKNLIKLLGMYFMFSLFLGCENKLEMTLPQGPQGPKGDPGLSAFDIWKEYYGKDPNTPIEDFFNSLKGKDGKDGAVPIIGDNGNWVIDGIDTGIPARGKDGKDGVTPEIGSNGNWYIGGVDTGVPAKGKDGSNGRNGLTPYIKDGTWWIGGEDTGVPVRGADGADGADGSDGSDGVDGVTPTIEVGPGPDYFWIINGTTTTISAKGKDGQDGLTPVVGNNGNWFIGGEDTGKPSVIIPTIGDNGNWFIGGVDTGKPARGPKGEDGQDGTDGVDGKSAYELWKEAVDEGEMTNKDGSPYTGGNTWEDFLIWLQGGDVSVLHQYWLSQGNTGDLQAFIDALFSCHCDGITVSVIALNECVELNPDGSLKKTYNATLKVGAAAGTTVVVTGDGLNLQGIVAAGASEVTFSIPRGKTDQQLAINCQLAGKTEQVTKYAVVSALKYIEITSPLSLIHI